jgi:hypothetical protein
MHTLVAAPMTMDIHKPRISICNRGFFHSVPRNKDNRLIDVFFYAQVGFRSRLFKISSNPSSRWSSSRVFSIKSNATRAGPCLQSGLVVRHRRTRVPFVKSLFQSGGCRIVSILCFMLPARPEQFNRYVLSWTRERCEAFAGDPPWRTRWVITVDLTTCS